MRSVRFVALLAPFFATVLVPHPVPAREAAYPLACRNVHADFDRYEHCARLEGTMVRVKPASMACMRFRGGLTEIVVDGVG